MSKSNALIAFALVLIVILFGFLMITLGEVRENVGEPEITAFEHKGITDYFAESDDDTWNVTNREDRTVAIEGATVQTGIVESLEPISAERMDNNTVKLTVGINRSYSSPVQVRSDVGSGEGQAVSVFPPQPIPLTYGYEMTVENVLEDEEIIVEVADVQQEESEDE